MSRRMTKDEAHSWMNRWRAVDERERRELRNETYDDRLEALAVLMASRDLFDLAALEEEDAAVRVRWAKLQSLVSRR